MKPETLFENPRGTLDRQHQVDWLEDGHLSNVSTHPPRARKRDPETSHEAAARSHEFSGKHASAIFCWLRDHLEQGGTFHEIAGGTGIDAIAVARRIAELRETAGVYDSGETRKSPTGRKATVWKVRVPM
jgi:hypothetical protein